MYSVDITKKARKFLKSIPRQDSEAIIQKIHSIRDNPIPHLKKLHGPFWRLRVLKYRAIIDVIISGKRMIVLKIGHRKNVYDE